MLVSIINRLTKMIVANSREGHSEGVNSRHRDKHCYDTNFFIQNLIEINIVLKL